MKVIETRRGDEKTRIKEGINKTSNFFSAPLNLTKPEVLFQRSAQCNSTFSSQSSKFDIVIFCFIMSKNNHRCLGACPLGPIGCFGLHFPQSSTKSNCNTCTQHTYAHSTHTYTCTYTHGRDAHAHTHTHTHTCT